MLRASLLANIEILPQARRGSYFFNRIGRLQPFPTGKRSFLTSGERPYDCTARVAGL